MSFIPTESHADWFCMGCDKSKQTRLDCSLLSGNEHNSGYSDPCSAENFPFHGTGLDDNIIVLNTALIIDTIIVDQLLSASLLRFWKTGADLHQLSV